MSEQLGRVWDVNYAQVIHVEVGDDGLQLVLPDGGAMVLSDHAVTNLRRMLQRYERERKRSA